MDTSKFTDGAELFRIVDWVNGGVGNAEMWSGKYYHSLVLKSLDPEKSPRIDNSATTFTDHN